MPKTKYIDLRSNTIFQWLNNDAIICYTVVFSHSNTGKLKNLEKKDILNNLYY